MSATSRDYKVYKSRFRARLLLDRLPAMGALTTRRNRCSIKKGTLPGNTSERI